MKFIAARRFWIGAIVSLACLWLAIRPVPFAVLAQALANANYIWLAPAIGLQVLAVIARAQRWVVLLRRKVSLADAFWVLGLGYLFTNVLPFRLGEAVRVVVLAKRRDLPLVQVAASALVERLLDVATILVALALVLPRMHVPDLVVRTGLAFGIVTVVALAGLLSLSRSRVAGDWILNLVLHYCKFLPADRVRARWIELVHGLEPIGTRRVAFEAACWSVITWTLSAGMYWCVLQAFRSDSLWVEAAFMLVSLSLASSVPSSPGFIGVFQLVGQQALVLPFGAKYDVATALAITLTGHLTYYLITSLLGLIGVLIIGQSLVQLGRSLAVGKLVDDSQTHSRIL